MRKVWMRLIISAAFFSMAVMMASCAKKQIQKEEGMQPKAAAPAEVERAPQKPAEAARSDEREELERKLQGEIQEFESQDIYFDFDKSELKPEARDVLNKKAQWLRANSPFSIRIEGHCDERGSNEYNLALGERRANAALNYLKALGVAESRMSIISFGEEKPADPGHNENAWSKNRRDEFRLSK